MGSGCCHPTLTPETKSASPSRRKAGKCGSLSMNICFMIISTIIGAWLCETILWPY